MVGVAVGVAGRVGVWVGRGVEEAVGVKVGGTNGVGVDCGESDWQAVRNIARKTAIILENAGLRFMPCNCST